MRLLWWQLTQQVPIMEQVQKQQAYQKFFATHVDSGVLDGLLDVVPAAALGNRNTDLLGFAQSNKGAISPRVLKTIGDNYTQISEFAKEFGAERLTFTKEGNWVIPPLLRDEFPAYKDYLLNASDEKVGTGAITMVQNEAIPTFENGEQTGGFETGDRHGFLTIVDKRNGNVYELQQTFLENSDEVEMRPNIAGLNYERAGRLLPKEELKKLEGLEGEAREEKLKEVLNEYVKRTDIELDSTGMVGGMEGSKQTGLASYGCELVLDVDAAFNWNDNRLGANFNYVPIAAVEFELNAQQLDVILFDRMLAARECEIRPEEGCQARQNEEGYVPGKRPSPYPDGTPRYVTAETVDQDGEKVVIFKNAKAETPGAVLVMEYDTMVKSADMQVTLPYNHFGASGMKGTQNCFGAACDILQGVAAHGSSTEALLKAIGGKNLRDEGINRIVQGLIESSNGVDFKDVKGPVDANIGVYNTPLKNGTTVKVYDFADLPEVAAKRAEDKDAEVEFGSLAGAAIAKTTAQRAQAVENKDRAPDDQLTLFPVGTVGKYMAQCHERDLSEKKDTAISPDKAAMRVWSGGKV